MCAYCKKKEQEVGKQIKREAETLSECRTCLEVKGADLSGEAADVADRRLC